MKNIHVIPKQETIREVVQRYYEDNIDDSNIPREYYEWEIQDLMIGFAYQWEQKQQNEWKTVLEETPPSNIELLVQSPEGINHLASWREGYSIFTCQEKSETSSHWKWKLI